MSVREGDTEVADFIQRHDLSYPFLLDRTGEVSTTYEVVNTPTTYFISPDGEVVDVLAGTMTQRWLEKNITAYLPGDPVPLT